RNVTGVQTCALPIYLRLEGVVVEPLGGLDDVADKLAAFGPDADHRVGVLADHLVEGTKESKIAEAVRADPRYRDVVHIIGHPYVDRKSTRLNSSHVSISYAVFCLKKK